MENNTLTAKDLTAKINTQQVTTWAGVIVTVPTALIKEAKESGTEWGKQEAQVQFDCFDASAPRRFPEWTRGMWCGDYAPIFAAAGVEYDGTDEMMDDLRDACEVILDRAAQDAYESREEEYDEMYEREELA